MYISYSVWSVRHLLRLVQKYARLHPINFEVPCFTRASAKRQRIGGSMRLHGLPKGTMQTADSSRGWKKLGTGSGRLIHHSTQEVCKHSRVSYRWWKLQTVLTAKIPKFPNEAIIFIDRWPSPAERKRLTWHKGTILSSEVLMTTKPSSELLPSAILAWLWKNPHAKRSPAIVW